METLAIILGILALSTWVISFQTNNKKKILLLQIVANIFYASQYAIYGAFSAVGMNTFSVIRNGVYYSNERKDKDNSKGQLYIFLAIIIVFGVLTVNSVISIFPIIATSLYTFGTWVKKTEYLRYIYLIAALIFLYYNYSIGAYVSLIGNFIEMFSGVVAIIRFDLEKSNKKVVEKNGI